MKSKRKMAIAALIMTAVIGLSGCKTTTTSTSQGGGGGSNTSTPTPGPVEKTELRMSQITIVHDNANHTLMATFSEVTGASKYKLRILDSKNAVVETKENYASGTILSLEGYEEGIYEVQAMAVAADTEKNTDSKWRSASDFFEVKYPIPEQKLEVSNAVVLEVDKESSGTWYVRIMYDALPANVFTSLFFYDSEGTLKKTIQSYSSGDKVILTNFAPGNYTCKIKALGTRVVENGKTTLIYLDSDTTDVRGTITIPEDQGGGTTPDKTKIVISNLQIQEEDENLVATWSVEGEVTKYEVSVFEGETLKYSAEENANRHTISKTTLVSGVTYTFKVKAIGDKVEFEDSDTLEKTFEFVTPDPAKTPNEITLVVGIEDGNFAWLVTATYFNNAVLKAYRQNTSVPVFTKEIDSNFGFLSYDEFENLKAEQGGRTLTFKVTIPGNETYETGEATFDILIPQSTRAHISNVSVIRVGGNLEIIVTATGNYHHAKAKVYRGDDDIVWLNNFADGKFVYDISSLGFFSATITVRLYDENDNMLDEYDPVAYSDEHEETFGDLNYSIEQSQDEEGRRVFEIETSVVIENADIFSWIILDGDTTVESGSCNAVVGSSNVTGRFVVNNDALENGHSYKLEVICWVSEGQKLKGTLNFVAITTQNITVVYDSETGRGELIAAPEINGNYKDITTGVIYRIVTQSDVDSEIVLEKTNYIDDETLGYTEICQLTKIITVSQKTIWLFEGGMKIEEENSDVKIYSGTNEMTPAATKPVATEEQKDAARFGNGEPGTGDANFTFIETSYGITYSDGKINVSGLTTAGTQTNHVGYFCDSDIDRSYVDNSENVFGSEGQKAILHGTDLIDLMGRVNGHLLTNLDSYYDADSNTVSGTLRWGETGTNYYDAQLVDSEGTYEGRIKVTFTRHIGGNLEIFVCATSRGTTTYSLIQEFNIVVPA